MADFFFEHGIKYSYEWDIQYSKKENGYRKYSPDFILRECKRKGLSYQWDYKTRKDTICIEFWGIDEFDPKKSIDPKWDKTWDEYKKEMEWKRKYWKDHE